MFSVLSLVKAAGPCQSSSSLSSPGAGARSWAGGWWGHPTERTPRTQGERQLLACPGPTWFWGVGGGGRAADGHEHHSEGLGQLTGLGTCGWAKVQQI